MASQTPTLFQSYISHDDVLERTLSGNEFPAKLTNVVFKPDDTPDIYADLETFFSKTYATDGLQTLLIQSNWQFVKNRPAVVSAIVASLSLIAYLFGPKNIRCRVRGLFTGCENISRRDLPKHRSKKRNTNNLECRPGWGSCSNAGSEQILCFNSTDSNLSVQLSSDLIIDFWRRDFICWTETSSENTSR